MKLRRNKRKHSTIKGLANHIQWFTTAKPTKQELALIRSTMADRVYAASFPVRERI